MAGQYSGPNYSDPDFSYEYACCSETPGSPPPHQQQQTARQQQPGLQTPSRAGSVAVPSPDPGQNAARHHENTPPAASACDTAAPPFSHRYSVNAVAGYRGSRCPRQWHKTKLTATAPSERQLTPGRDAGLLADGVHHGALGPDGVKAWVGAEAKAAIFALVAVFIGRVRASRGALRADEPDPTFHVPGSGGKWACAGSRRRFLSGGWAGRP